MPLNPNGTARMPSFPKSTLAEDIESLGRTANRIADQRNALLRLVRQAIATSPGDSVAWNAWIEEAQETLNGFERELYR